MATLDSVEISGMLRKKRGGFGKMMPNAWQSRFFTINKDGVLSYYDLEIPETDSKPRGKIDLKAVPYELFTDHHIEGAPTPYSIQIIPNGEERWNLCAETCEDHFRWKKVLERYLTEKEGSFSKSASKFMMSYNSDDDADVNRRLTKSISTPVYKKSMNDKPNSSSFFSSKDNITPSDVAPLTTSMSLPVNLTNSIPAMPTPNSSTHETVSRPALLTRKKGLRIERPSNQDWNEILIVVILLNMCLLFSMRANTGLESLFYILIANGVTIHTLNLRGQRYTNNVAKEAKDTAAKSIELKESKAQEASTTKAQKMEPETTLVANETKVAHDASIVDVIPAMEGKRKPGFTFQQAFTEPRLAPDHSWCQCDSRLFNVRVGPNYDRFKKKAPSGPPLYEAFAVDVFCTKQRIDHAARIFDLPDTSSIDTHNSFVPPLFIIQIQIPTDPPAIFTSTEDGPGWAILMYFRITEDTCNQLKNIETASPAVKLFATWCEKAFIDAAWRARFKVINSCTNLEELGMPSTINNFNAKPVLIRRTGTLFRGSNYIEFNIHVHKFANLAKQSIYLISSRCGLMYMQIGFVIEGRDDKELPETMFACVAVNKPQEELGEFIEDVL